jgi:1-acyl-sn-glycerol-3-phosphate acyltransferase
LHIIKTAKYGGFCFLIEYICTSFFTNNKSMLEKIISVPFTIFYYFLFLLWLLISHPIQVICHRFLGPKMHHWSVAILNLFLVRTTHVLGTSYKIIGREKIPTNVPVVFVSNHQSMYDITTKIWFLRKHYTKFVSKIELGKGIPSVSYNLRNGGSALIDRKDGKQALNEIKKVAELIQKNNYSVVIYPEGTRSKTGKAKEFATNGLKMLYKFAPDAYFVPITVNNAWKMNKFGSFPLGLGNCISLLIHEPLKISEHDFDTIFTKTQEIIIKHIQ